MRLRRAVLPLIAAVATLSVVLVVPEVGGVDEYVRYRVAESIVERGELNFAFNEALDDKLLTVYENPHTKKVYGLWNIGQSLVLVPFVALGKGLERLGETPAARSMLLGLGTNVAYCVVINVLLALATLAVLRQMRLSRKSAAFGVLVLLLCTQWLVWGHSLQEESLCALLLMVALWCGLRAVHSTRHVLWACAMGACFGFLANVRFNAGFAAGAVLIGVALMMERRRALVFFAICVVSTLPFAGLTLWYNWARTGDALLSPYMANFALMQAEAAKTGQTMGYQPSLVRYFHILFGLDNGFIWFSLPLLLLFSLRGKRGGYARLGLLMVAGVLGHVVVLCGFYAGTGVQGAGSPRYLAHQAILLGPLCWLGARRAWLIGTREESKRLLRVAPIFLFAISMPLQFAARLLNPELEHSQDGAFADATGKSPQPYYYLPRRLVNVKRALSGELAAYSFPQGMSTLEGFSVRNEQAEIRHTLIELPPVYFAYTRRFLGLESSTGLILAWSGAVSLHGFCAGLVILQRRRRFKPSA